jgi:hypothetical protein
MQRSSLSLLIASALLLLVAGSSRAETPTGFTTQVSPGSQTDATEPFIAIDRSDGTVWVAWQASGSHVARSDDGGRTFTEMPINDPLGSDVGDVAIRVGGPAPCAVATQTCLPRTHRIYLTSISLVPTLQTRLAYSDDRGANWTFNRLAAFNPSFVDRPWLAVYPSNTIANQDQVYVAYHDFSASQIWVASSNNGGDAFLQTNVFANNPMAEIQSFCNTVPSDIEVDPETGEVYVAWITADPVANTTDGCNITQLENFHQVWIAHSPPADPAMHTVWDAHLVFDGNVGRSWQTNTDRIFATLAVDDSGTPGVPGNVYSVFPDNLLAPGATDIWFTHSSDKGRSWAAPVKVNPDTGTHYFPWIAAGSSGRVDFIWLSTPDLNSSDAALSPWTATFAQTTSGASATPKFNQTTASSNVMHVGGICTDGIFCTVTGGNRDLADSISIAIDRGGSAGLVWTDQGNVLHGPTHITYRCVTAQQSAIAGASPGLSCKGPAGP